MLHSATAQIEATSPADSRWHPGPTAACSQCGTPATKKCSRCRAASYCSAACQRYAWPQHKSACARAAKPASAADAQFTEADRCTATKTGAAWLTQWPAAQPVMNIAATLLQGEKQRRGAGSCVATELLESVSGTGRAQMMTAALRFSSEAISSISTMARPVSNG